MPRVFLFFFFSFPDILRSFIHLKTYHGAAMLKNRAPFSDNFRSEHVETSGSPPGLCSAGTLFRFMAAVFQEALSFRKLASG